MSSISPDQIARLRDAETNVVKSRLIETDVIEYWKVIFSPKGIASLTKQDMTGFLSFRQNKRWREISKEDVTTDMDRLRSALLLLIDDSLTVQERLNRLEPGRGKDSIPYLGKAKLTPILLVTHPSEYGVWNDYSSRAIVGMGLMPTGIETARLGDAYAQVNDVLVRLAKDYRLSLWRLDIILEQIARLIR